MSEPRKTKILARLKINEVSLVDRGAGHGCRVIISKRADDDIDDWYKKEAAEEDRQNGVHDSDWYKQQADTAELQTEAHLRREERRQAVGKAARERFIANWNKSFAADARGDEADDQDEATPSHELDSPPPPDGTSSGVPAKHRPITFDVGDKTITARNERALARWLAVQERITKSLSEDSTAMSTTLNLSEIVKAHGVVSLCKYMCEQSSSFGASEADLVNLATQDAHRRYPDVTEAQAFAKLFMESNELRDAIEIAKRAAFQSDVTAEIEKDARAACEELTRIGKARWGSLSPSQRFARAFETNPELARRASPRPGPSTSFPHPSVAKTLAPNVVLTVGDLKPATSTETDPNDATRALAQLRALGARKWPSKSEAESFLLAITDAENVDLVNRALARPTGSTPPRQ